jgi:Tfp pilus assembly protein PilW
MEMMVAMTIGGIILGAFVATTITVSRTMVAVGNYNDLNKFSRIALDRLNRDVRNANNVGVTSTTTQLILTNLFSGTSVITYKWDGSNIVTRTVTGAAADSSYVLTNCDVFAFNYYQRNPTNNYDFVTTTHSAQVKLISVSWRCSRAVLGLKLNTESVQTAKVVLRN